MANESIHIGPDDWKKIRENLGALNDMTPDELAQHVAQRKQNDKRFLIVRVQVWEISAKALKQDYQNAEHINGEIADDVTENFDPDAQIRVVSETSKKIDLDAYVRNLLKDK